eukprot:CAMPEP_0181330728 /NCGR_PEP_ID=MMETSP1101-20121128/24081_1 /TAXON_ID=46948 /ORGANISM="Rhodomonas abbreviata, Strain Caron Lab Isolate" /LENGTH=564 /DNA_ID=CAMNT_0023440057 /DNA_START=16 /DNA_END=1710 /DNA_ORIENTATION=+
MNMITKAVVLLAVCAYTVSSTALDDYVWAEDSNYAWTEAVGDGATFSADVAGRKYTAYNLNMTSQRWLTDADFSADSQGGSIWWHYLTVIVPDDLKFTQNASMYITGGSMSMGMPHARDEDITVAAALACNTGTITATLFQIPNEHLTFASDPIQKSRSEDAIIAYTWDHFLAHPDQPEWLLRFPMVKASLRAMDTMTAYVKQKRPELNTQLDYYVVAGASKRGWTSWDVGAVDPNRVMGIVPIVLDAINFVEVEHHQFRSYGAWTYALVDYVEMNLTERFDDPNMVLLQQEVDPFFYKDRLTMPKLVVNTAMDEFQQPDDNFYWWNDMPVGEGKALMMLPNTEHSCATGILEMVPAIGAWIQALLYKDAVPSFDWTISDATGEITATLNEHGKVHSATMWYAESCGQNAFDNNKNRRDFRIAHLDNPCSCGPFVGGMCINLKTFWKKEELEMTMVKGKRTYKAVRPTPTDGTFVGFFIDIKYHNPRSHDFGEPMNMNTVYKNIEWDEDRASEASKISRKFFPEFGGFPHDFNGDLEFTTQVSVMPNIFPYPDCTGVDCGITMV